MLFFVSIPPTRARAELSRAELSQGLEESGGGALNAQEEGSAELDDAELALEADVHNQQPRNNKRDLKS